MTRDEHKACHKFLHRCLDELVSDFIGITGGFPSKTNLMEFMRWSHHQTISPTENKPCIAKTENDNIKPL